MNYLSSLLFGFRSMKPRCHTLSCFINAGSRTMNTIASVFIMSSTFTPPFSRECVRRLITLQNPLYTLRTNITTYFMHFIKKRVDTALILRGSKAQPFAYPLGRLSPTQHFKKCLLGSTVYTLYPLYSVLSQLGFLWILWIRHPLTYWYD